MIDTGEIDRILECVKDEPSESYESETVEFKEYKSEAAFHNNSQEVVKEISAMANKSGGILVVGVKDSSNVVAKNWQSQLVGFDKVDCLEIKKRVQGNLNPRVNLEVLNHSFEGNNFLLIGVDKNVNGLVMTTGGKCYVRSGRDSNPMTPPDVENKIKSMQGYDWSSEILDSINVNDALDDHEVEEAMIEYQSLKGLGESQLPQEHFLETIGVTSRGQLTKGGLLFLGKSEVIQSLVGNIEYRCSKREKGGLLPINEVWSGSLWDAITRIRKFLKQVTKYDEFVYDNKRYLFPNICKVAFEEAMVNSLVHRDYTLNGLTTIELEGTSVTFTNRGSFYDGVTPSNIFTHPPRHRNPALASILMNFELVDRAGMGTRRMNIESLRHGRREPKFCSANDSISTSLESSSIKEGVFVTTSPYEDYDVAELFLINLLYGKGYEEINSVFRQINALVNDSWREVSRALERVHYLSLVGNKDGIYVVVNDSHRGVLNAYRKIRVYQSSDNYVSIFRYLFEHDEASSNELYTALNIDSLAKTQRLLREAKFIKKVQSDDGATWQLI